MRLGLTVRWRASLGCLAACVFAVAAPDAVAVEVLAQTRVNAAFGMVDSEFAGRLTDGAFFSQAPDFGPWDDEVVAGAENLFGFGKASAVQDTAIGLDPGISAMAGGGGATSARFNIVNPGYESSSEGSAESAFELVFALDRPTPYSLEVALQADLADLFVFSGPGPVLSSVQAVFYLLSETDVILSREVEDSVPDEQAAYDEFTAKGVLPPGTYQLQFGSGAMVRGWEDAIGSGSSGYSFLFLVPEPRRDYLTACAILTMICVRRCRSSSSMTKG